MLRVVALLLLFVGLAVVGLAAVATMSAVEPGDVSEPLADSYNFTQSSAQLGFSILGSSYIFFALAFVCAVLAISAAALHMR